MVGWIDKYGSRTVAYGRTKVAGGQKVNGQTIFEIGSVTKVFTAVLLAQAIERGEMNLNDPVARYLPLGAKLPVRAGREITLLDLATHHSGLPSMPDNLHPADEGNPFADYTPDQMFAFLSKYDLPRDIGSQFEYSNLGFGLLGMALTRQAGTSYENLVVQNICVPLGMPDTRITLTPKLKARLAQPHDEALSPTENWDLSAFDASGGLHSDADDMIRFVAANLDCANPQLRTALRATHRVYNTTDSPGTEIALGWNVTREHNLSLVWKSGGTGGYVSFVGFDQTNYRGVVVLSNAAEDVDDIGMHLLDKAYPLTKPPNRTAIALNPGLGNDYVGHYQADPGFVFTFSRDGDKYYLQGTGQIRFRALPFTENDFFLKRVGAQISFLRNQEGKVVSLILHQNGEKTYRRL